VFERVVIPEHPTVVRQTPFSDLKDEEREQQLTKLQQQYNA
jgi:hypothetical protein